MRADLIVALTIAAGAAAYCLSIHEPWWAAVPVLCGGAWWYVTK